MLTQHYKIKASAENMREGRPGTPVFDDETDDVIGFVDFISDIDMCIMLFSPTDYEEFKFVNLAEKLEDSVWQDRLNEIVQADDEMHDFWSGVFGEEDDE